MTTPRDLNSPPMRPGGFVRQSPVRLPIRQGPSASRYTWWKPQQGQKGFQPAAAQKRTRSDSRGNRRRTGYAKSTRSERSCALHRNRFAGNTNRRRGGQPSGDFIEDSDAPDSGRCRFPHPAQGAAGGCPVYLDPKGEEGAGAALWFGGRQKSHPRRGWQGIQRHP